MVLMRIVSPEQNTGHTKQRLVVKVNFEKH